MMVAADATQLISPSTASAALQSPASDDSSEGRTILVPLAALIAEDGVLSQTVYQLGAVNYLGRAEDNQVQITSPGVSRKHAVIIAAAGGFQLKDLGSQNGVVVNGERVTERKLADNDRIEIADVSLVFRSPWPAPTVKSATGGTSAKPGARN
jgi:pSer/pThr/pTyr-binding forkhead associated (FHA) protein